MKFVVDAYTFRIFSRLGLIKGNDYDYFQKVFESILPKDLKLYKEFHALIVKLGKEHCKVKPLRRECPLKEMCEFYKTDEKKG